MLPDATAFYDKNPDISARYQGDILDGVPVLAAPGEGGSLVLLRPPAGEALKDVLTSKALPRLLLPRPEGNLTDSWTLGTEFILTTAERRRVMVVTQTCDIDNRTATQIVPVYPVSSLRGDERRFASLRAQEIGYLFHLPQDGNFDESFADLSQISLSKRIHITKAPLVRRLQTASTTHLQRALTVLHGRQFVFGERDESPQDADYLCFTCFLMELRVTMRRFAKGMKFPKCDACGRPSWIKAGRQGDS